MLLLLVILIPFSGPEWDGLGGFGIAVISQFLLPSFVSFLEESGLAEVALASEVSHARKRDHQRVIMTERDFADSTAAFGIHVHGTNYNTRLVQYKSIRLILTPLFSGNLACLETLQLRTGYGLR